MSLYDYDDQEPTRLSHSGLLMSSIFSTDGNFLASGSDDGSIKIWKLSENQSSEKNLIIQDSQTKLKIRSLCFSPDNMMIAASMFDPKIHVFSVELGNLMYKFGDFSSKKTLKNGSPCIATADSKLVVGGDDGNNNVYVWSWNNLEVEKAELVLSGHTRGISAIASKSILIITGSYDTTVRIWDNLGNLVNVLLDHTQPIIFILSANDKDMFFTGSQDRSIINWSLVPYIGFRVATFDGLDDWVSGIFQPDNEKICAVSINKVVRKIGINLTEYDDKCYKIKYTCEICYIWDKIAEMAVVYLLFEDRKNVGKGIVYLALVLIPNIFYFLLHYSKYYKNCHDLIVQCFLIFCFLKYPAESWKNYKSPTFIDKRRVHMKSLRFFKLIEVLYSEAPTQIMAIYFVFFYAFENHINAIFYVSIYKLCKIPMSVAKPLSWNFNDLNYTNYNKFLLLLYRYIEVGTKMVLLAMFCVATHPGYIFLIFAVSSFLHFALFMPPKTEAKIHWSEKLLKNIQIISNAFAFTFCEEPVVVRNEETHHLVPVYKNLIFFRAINISKIVVQPRNVICPHATITHVFFNEFINFIINLIMTIIIYTMKKELKQASIVIMVLTVFKLWIPFVIRRNLMKQQQETTEEMKTINMNLTSR